MYGKMTPEIAAYDILRNEPLHKDRETLEQTLCSDAECSYKYARYVMNAENSWDLARYVIKGRFLLGEAAISKDAEYSFWYAKYVIRGSWTQELAVMCPCWLFLYAKDVSKGRLPKAMHNKMLVFGMIDSSDKYVKKYLEKKLKNDSRNSV